MPEDLFLGVDGGQSHTEAIVANSTGNILGRGRGGPSNHADEPGGRERLQSAVTDSVGEGLRAAGLAQWAQVHFVSAHFAMTGGADFKEDVIRSLVHARDLAVGHDAPAALAGASGCRPGIIIIAGTGSVAYGESATGACAHAGGFGYLFGDEGAGFGIALQAVRRAAQAQDGLSHATPLLHLALDYFKVSDIHKLVRAVYSGQLRRDEFAAFAKAVCGAASEVAEARLIIEEGTRSLAALALAVAQKLKLPGKEIEIFCAGGMFRDTFFVRSFEVALQESLPHARIGASRFAPVLGALLLAYRAAGIPADKTILSKLDSQNNSNARAGKRN